MSKSKLRAQFFKLDSAKRLYGLDKPILGLTGSIATGKSSVSKILKNKGFAVIDADMLVKNIYNKQETIEFIKSLNKDYITDNNIDFKKLRASVFSDSVLKSKIEGYIYPKLESEFLKVAAVYNKHEFLIYDVPLLFEKKMQDKFDSSVCVYSPQKIQLERLMNRDNCNKNTAMAIIESQIDIEDKRSMSEYTIDNSGNSHELMQQVDKFIKFYML